MDPTTTAFLILWTAFAVGPGTVTVINFADQRSCQAAATVIRAEHIGVGQKHVLCIPGSPLGEIDVGGKESIAYCRITIEGEELMWPKLIDRDIEQAMARRIKRTCSPELARRLSDGFVHQLTPSIRAVVEELRR